MAAKPTHEMLIEKIDTLEKKLETYQVLVENSPDLLYRTDLHGRIVYASGSVLHLSGYTVEEAIGMKMAEEVYLVPEERRQFLAKLQEAGQVSNFVARLRRKDGSIWWASTNAHFLKDSDGNIIGVEGVTRDISELKSAEEALRASDEKYRHLFKTAMVGIYRTRIADGTFLAANHKLAQMMGYPSVDTFIQEYITTEHYVDPNRRQELLQLLETQGQVEDFEIEMTRRDGSTIQIALSAAIDPDQGFLEGFVVDITDRKLAERELQASKARLEALSEASFEAIFFSEKGLCIDQNQTAEKMFGYSRLESLGRPGTDWIALEDRQKVTQHMLSGREASYQATALRKDGSRFPCEIQARMKEYQGRTIRTTALRDISLQTEAARKLRENEEKYRRIFENSVLGFFQSTREGRFISVNPAFAKMMRYDSPEDLIDSITDIASQYYVNPEDRLHYQQVVQQEGKIENYEFQARRKDGSQIWVSNSTRAYHTPDGQIRRYEGVVVDITQRKLAEQELRDLNETMDLAQEMAGIGYWRYDLETGKRIWSNKMFAVFGYESRPEPPGIEEFRHRWHPEDWNTYSKAFQAALTGTPYNIEVRITFPDKQTHFIHTQGHPRLDDKGRIIGLYGTSQDITTQKRAHEALKENEEKFRALVENSPQGISLIGPDGRYKYVNPRFIEMFGYTLKDVPTGRHWFQKAYPDENLRATAKKQWIEGQQQAASGYALPRTFKVTCKDGRVKDILFTPVTKEHRDHFVICEDITDRRRLEQQLQQTQKLDAIGTLAGGIAHDFNNLLMGIQGRASLMDVELGPAHAQKEHLDAIEEYIRSATNLTRQLLGFSRGGKYEVKPVDLNELLLNSASMFQRTRKEIRIHNKTQPDPVVVEADKRQIEQVLLNIYINAWQAMPAGGDLFLETKVVTLDAAAAEAHQLENGRYARMTITDTGTGMPDNIRQRIFDPFFTTKHKSRGTGLGLASAYGIIKNHGGIITVYSETALGTTFNIYLPLSEKESDQDAPAESDMLMGSETILLVDDEKMILEVGAAMLVKLGYQVIAADGGEPAVAKLLQMGDQIDLVILDMIMPGMDGGTTFDRIRAQLPTMPVLLSSGYAMNGRATEILERGCNGFIQKPFNLSELSKKVREVLDAAG
jgi:two-component system cell cycle sensor histidine kinase/response regulator CckA